ncbi:putative reverse transcriptase domain-containing protein, partial [Tanacetum coccineum]
MGLSSVVHYELQAYRTHTQIQDFRIASQESLTTTLIAQISSLQGQLSATLGQIQALQARDQTHADDPEGAENLYCCKAAAAATRAAAAVAPMTTTTVTQDVAYAMDWKTLKKMMTVKYGPRGEINKRMFHEESDEVEKYVGGLPDMILGNMDQKVLTIDEKQAEQKRKLEFNAGNNQGHQQQNKRQNTRRAYTAEPGEKREYTGSLPLCTKCNYHHKGPCAPRCNNYKKIGHLARDCMSPSPNGNNNNRGNSRTTQNAGTCYECGVQGYFKRDCPKLKNRNRGNQGGNGNALTKVYVVGNAGTNPDSNVVTGTFLLNNRYASILFDTGANRSFVSTTFSSIIDITPTTL